MADRRELLFAEVDRQLEEVREQANALATRSGVIISAVALVAAVFAVNLKEFKTGELFAVTLLAMTVFFGFFVLVPALSTGPLASSLTSWAASPPPDDPLINQLYAAKIIVLESNVRRLSTMTILFYLQIGVGLLAVVAALISVARR